MVPNPPKLDVVVPNPPKPVGAVDVSPNELSNIEGVVVVAPKNPVPKPVVPVLPKPVPPTVEPNKVGAVVVVG